MSYVFTPLTDEELDSKTFSLLEEGDYSFEVSKAVKKTSKAGNAMAELQLKIWDKYGKINYVFDYLIFSNVPLNIKKVKHFCESTGIEDCYKKGSIPEELQSLCGKVKIGIGKGNEKPDGGFYPDKNIVIDYLKDKSIVNVKNAEDNFDDELPF